MRIFLSYPHKDNVETQQLQTVLRSGGHTVWMDDELITGPNWKQQLENQIKQADAIALAITPNWLASPYCQWEFITAVENGKKVIPVLLAGKSQLPSRLSQYQYMDFRGGFGDTGRVQKFLDDLLKLAVMVDKSLLVGMDKAEYAAKTEREHQGSGDNIKVGGSTNTVAGHDIDQSRTKISIGGSVTGGNVNIGGKQEFQGNTTISYTTSSQSNDNPRREIEQLSKQLLEALARLSPEHKEDAEVVAALTQEVVSEASKDKPNRKLLEIKGQNLKTAAKLLTVSPIADKIAKTVLLI